MRLGIVLVRSKDGKVRHSGAMAMSKAREEYRLTQASPTEKVILGEIVKKRSRTVPSVPDTAPDSDLSSEDTTTVEPATAAPEPTTKRKYNRKDN